MGGFGAGFFAAVVAGVFAFVEAVAFMIRPDLVFSVMFARVRWTIAGVNKMQQNPMRNFRSACMRGRMRMLWEEDGECDEGSTPVAGTLFDLCFCFLFWYAFRCSRR